MSLPDELLDELLSGYLDGVLSGDEQSRVEQLVRDDSDVRRRLEDLRYQINATRSAALPAPGLPKGFSQQVVQAAIERAQQEQLGADHPLIRAGQQSPDNAVNVQNELASASRFNSKHVIGIVASVAASILLISLAVRDGDQSDPSVDPVAMVPAQPEENKQPSDVVVAKESGDPSAELTPKEIENHPAMVPDEAIVKVETDSSDSTNANAIENPVSPNMIAEATEEKVTRPADIPGVVEGNPQEMVAESRIPSLSLLMIVEVRLTDLGRQGQAFEDALVSAEITPSQERMVDDQLTNLATANSDAGSSDEITLPKVVFLEAPVIQLDKLVNQLARDSEGVQRVGFSLIDNAELLQPINAVRVKDPTEVRHQAQGWPIVGQSEKFQGWTSQLGERGFVPWGNGAQVPRPRSGGGPNPPGNLLILIR